MTQNGEAIPQDHRLLRRNAARTAIVEAGRRLAARDGVAQLSLSAVAAEAGFGPSTVFGHFRNKDELLIAIAAEDLAALAALMRGDASLGGAFVQPDYLGAAAWQDTYTQPVLEPANEAGSLDFSRSEVLDLKPADVLTDVLDADSAEANLPPNDTNDSPHGETSPKPRVDAWLERRLRVFEHTLSDIESRLKDTESNATKSLSLSEHGMKSLFERMEAFERQQSEAAQALTQRMEETERRQRGTTSEMRAAMNDTATRIEILESKLRSDQERGAFGKRMAETREAVPTALTPESPELPADKLDDHETYAAAAERATSAAAALAEMQEEPATDSSAWQSFAARRVRVGRKHVLMLACFTAVMFVLAGFVAFYAGHARGRDTAVAAQFASKPVHAKQRTAAQNRVTPAAPADPRSRLATLAQAGNAKAQLVLGLQYLHGEGVAPDRRVAADWVRRAAAQQDPLAQYWLGTLFERGDGMSADSTEAVRWYEAAAGQGNRKAMHALGVAYAQGLGTQRDYSQAARWFTSAAEMGLVNSQFNLGVLYERGLGVPQNLMDAYKWYSIAAAQGDSESRARVEVLKTQLNADDLFASERAAAGFRPQNVSAGANNLPTLADLTGTIVRR